MKSKTSKTGKVSKIVRKQKKGEYLQNSRGIVFCVGDTVKLTDRAFKTCDSQSDTFAGRPIAKAKIAKLLLDREKTVQLEQKLGGYWTWSVEDLTKVEHGKH